VAGVDGQSGGELHAMMLDMKRTFDEIVLTHAETARARMILDNPFYQSLSAGFAGTQEYMAMEKLGQLRSTGEWDLIVVDTPPSRSALDFLDAPQRMSSFLDGRFIKVLMAPAKVGGRGAMKFLNVGMSMMTGALNKVLGTHVLQDVQTFVAAMDTMFGGFRERADKTYRLLQAPGTAFLVVAAPERDALREASYFVERLADESMPLAGLVLNRVHGSDATRLTAERALAAAEALEEAERDAGADPAPGPGAGTRPETEATDMKDAGDTAYTIDAANGAVTSEGSEAEENQEGTGIKDRLSGQAGLRNPGDPSGGDSPDDGSPGHQAAVPTAQGIAAGLLRLHAERMHVIARERRQRDRFVSVHPEVPMVEVPALPGDVHDLDGLRAIGERLAASG
jgi:anion-transporting  ArsA/GET3 family ATPase